MSPDLLSALLTIALGAVAGGVTNTVAVWMLFHPYEPPRVGRWTLSFFQGAIPKNQARLAEAIGRTVGERLGRGEALADIIDSMNMVAEGVKSSRALLGLAEQVGVEMPITQGVVAVCHGGHDPTELVGLLMSREAKPEIYGL